MKILLPLLFLIISAGCASRKANITTVAEGPQNVLDSLLQSDTSAFGNIIRNKDSFNVQIIYSRIDRDATNKPRFTDYTFNLNSNSYFYPASTVKMPAAFLALEKLNKLKLPGVDKYTPMVTDSSFSGQQWMFTDAMSENGAPTVADYIKQTFLVSDNDAFNRLYEFLGQEYFNKELVKKGFTSSEIIHRLSIFLSEEQNRQTNRVTFRDTAGNILYDQPALRSNLQYSGKVAKVGTGYYSRGKLVKAPFDFSLKNRVSLTDLHGMLRSVIFPEIVREAQRFDLTAEDYAFLYKYMSAYPREVKYPGYDTVEHYDAYAKFLLHGSGKERLDGKVRIFNKIGLAYGYLTDAAYIIDFENNVEFMLSATILCNTDRIFNDDKYDFNTIGFPFLKKLGEVVLQYERQRRREHKPDLQKFAIDYTK